MMIAAIATILLAVSGTESTSPTAPLNGTFAVEFGSQTKPNGQPYGSALGGSETWQIESACRDGACVATASKVNGSVSTSSTMVLDKTDGGWKAVSASPGTCQNAPAETWEVMTLQARPDGNLQGDFIVRSTSGCARNQHVTFTRTGDVQKTMAIGDPAAQPPRVASPAAGLHGRYQETDVYADGGRNAEVNFDIQSYCLRNGQRCLSYWSNPNDAKILVFSENQWVLTTTTGESQCKSGARAHREIDLRYPLPQAPQDPITQLTGRGHYTVTGDCPFNSDFDSRLQRTGN
jgi:serine/threonine-protein kinase